VACYIKSLKTAIQSYIGVASPKIWGGPNNFGGEKCLILGK